MNETIGKIIKLYLFLTDCIEGQMEYHLFVKVFILEEKVSERTFNECYYISNGTRWKSKMTKLIKSFDQDYDNIYKKILNIIKELDN